MPLSSRSFGELTAPAASSTSRSAVASFTLPWCRKRTPVTRFPSIVSASASAPVRTVRLAPPEDRPQEALRRAPPDAAPLVDLEIAGPLVVAGVEIRRAGNAEFLCGILEGVEHRPGQPLALHPPLAACPVQRRGAGVVVFRLPEEGQHVVPAPAAIPQLPPMVVVGSLAAHVDHAVDRRAAPQHLAAGVVQGPAVETGFRLGLHHPVGAGIAHALEIPDRNIDPMVAVAAAGFEQQHPVSRIGAQPVRQHAPRRPRPHDDEVVVSAELGRTHRLSSPLCFRQAHHLHRLGKHEVATVA